MELKVTAGFRGITVGTAKGPLKIKTVGKVRSVQKCKSSNVNEYVNIGIELDNDEMIKQLENDTVQAVLKLRDDIFLKTMRLKMSEEDVQECFRPFKSTLNIFPGREGKDSPICFGNNDPTLDYTKLKEYIDEVIDNETTLEFELSCVRLWCGKGGMWGLGWDVKNAKTFSSTH
jgi:hypothetical protein